MMRILTSLLLVTISVVSFCQTNADSLESKLESYQLAFSQEKIYLHLNRSHYRIGQTVWFKIYLLDANSHKYSRKSNVVRLELIDPSGEVVARRMIKTTDGNGHGDFLIGSLYEPGYYTIRAYTNWMRNFAETLYFTTSFSVYPIEGLVRFRNQEENENSIQVGFFPEGGAWIGGIESKLGIKAINASGFGIQLSGIIVDSVGDKVAPFSTDKMGFGSVVLTPEDGITYRALVSTSKSEESYELPEVKDSGAVLKLNSSFSSSSIALHAKSDKPLTGSSLVIHQRGTLIKSFNYQDDLTEFSVDIEKEGLAPGVCHATLFNQYGLPMAERLFAANINEEAVRGVIQSEKIYDTESEIELNLGIEDPTGNLLASSLSVAIDQLAGIDYERGENIKSYLLLTSDLEGSIENPNSYFANNQEAYERLELLMLTQGWKRFDWEEVLIEAPQKIKFKPEIGARLSGQVVDFSNRTKPRQGLVSVSTGLRQLYDVETDENGYFELVGINIYDTVKLNFKAQRRVGKKAKLKDDVYIKIAKASFPSFTREESWRVSAEVFDIPRAELSDTAEFNLLREVVIRTRKKLSRSEYDPFAKAKDRYGKPSVRIIADSLLETAAPRSFVNFLQGVPGVAIGGTGSQQFIRFQGSSNSRRMFVSSPESAAPLYLINGVPASEASAFNLNPYDIYFIDLLTGNETSIFGVRGGNGVIAIYLRGLDSYRPSEESGSLTYEYPGYYTARSFTASNVLPFLKSQNDPLGRAVHWEPMIGTEDGKQARVSFKSIKEPAIYLIKMEGITKTGIPISTSKVVKTE